MPMLSEALYLGQFISPLIIIPLSNLLFGADDVVSPYKITIGIGVIYLIQVWATRHIQSLPPEEHKNVLNFQEHNL